MKMMKKQTMHLFDIKKELNGKDSKKLTEENQLEISQKIMDVISGNINKNK